MAEFSYEYIAKVGLDTPFDFSIQDVFNGLSDGEIAYEICEGFGFTRIHRNANQCLLWFPRIDRYVSLEEIMSAESLKPYHDGAL
jgi:hypothetical protein